MLARSTDYGEVYCFVCFTLELLLCTQHESNPSVAHLRMHCTLPNEASIGLHSYAAMGFVVVSRWIRGSQGLTFRLYLHILTYLYPAGIGKVLLQYGGLPTSKRLESKLHAEYLGAPF